MVAGCHNDGNDLRRLSSATIFYAWVVNRGGRWSAGHSSDPAHLVGYGVGGLSSAMKIGVEWGSLLKLKDGKRENLIYTVSLATPPMSEGVYVFGRRFGKSLEALYVGKARRIRGRVKTQLDHVRLMQHIKNAKAGKQLLLAGQVLTRPGQQVARVLRLAARALIRYFPSEGHDLVNKQGTRIRRHKLMSSGKQPKRFIPRVTYLERARSE